MGTNVIEVFLKFKKEGDEFIRQTAETLEELQGGIEDLSSVKVSGGFIDPLLKALEEAGVGVEETAKLLKELQEVTQDPLSSAYADGLVQALQSTDKEALKTKLSLASVQEELAQGGKGAAALLGLMDGLGMTSQAAEDARASIAELNNVDLDKTKKAFEDISDAVSGLGETANKSGGFSNLENAMKKAEGGVMTLAGAVKGLIGVFAGLAVVGYLKDAVQVAARAQVLQTVLHQVGRTAGYTTTELDKADKAVQKLGITSTVSRESLAQLINTGLSLDLAGPLARAAQDLAVVAGWNSSETFGRLLTNISQMDTMGLRFMGIMVDRTKAEQAYAASIGKTVDALSGKEQKEAFASAVLQEATKRQGIYEASMNDAAKQAQSLARLKETLAETIGKRLLPAYSELIKQFSLFLSETEKSADAIDKQGDSAKAFGEAVGLVAFAIRDAINFIKEHSEAVGGLIAAYAGFKVLVAAGGVVTSIVALATAFETGGAAIALLATKLGLIGAGSVGIVASLGTIAVAIAAIAGAVWGLVKMKQAWDAYWDMTKARKNLQDFQNDLSDSVKKLPESYKEAFDSFKEDAEAATNTTGKTKEQITAQMESMAKAVEYAGKRYALAMSKGKNATEEDKKAIDDWHNVVEAKIIPAFAKMAAARDAAEGAKVDPGAQRYADLRAKVAELTATYGDLNTAVQAYIGLMGKAIDLTYSQAGEGLKLAYKEEQALLEATEQYQGQNRQKMLENDRRYFEEAQQLAKDEFEHKRQLMDQSFAIEKTALEKVIKLKLDGGQKVEAEQAKLAQAEQRRVDQSIQLTQQEMSRVMSLRDEAFNKYVGQLRELQSIQREMANETINHEVRIAELQMRYRDDEFQAREDAIRAKEQELDDRERRSPGSNFQKERQAISEERAQLAKDRESQEKAIEAMASTKFQEYLGKAREELAKGKDANMELVKEYERAAQTFGNYAKSNADKQKVENDLYDVKMGRLRLSGDIAKQSADQQKQAFDSINSAVVQLTATMSDLIIKMVEMSVQSQQMTYTTQMEGAVAEMEALAAARERAMSSGDPKLWTPDHERQHQASMESLRKQVQGWAEARDAAQKTFEKFAEEQRAKVDMTDVDKAIEKSQVLEDQINKTYGEIQKGGTAKIDIEVDDQTPVQQARQVKQDVQREVGWGRPLTLQIDADPSPAINKAQRAKTAVAAVKPAPWKIEITDLATGEVRRIDQETKKILKPGTIKITPAVDGVHEALNSVDRRKAEVSEPVDIPLDMPVEGALSAVDTVQTALNRLGTQDVEVEASIEPDTARVDQATAEIDGTVVSALAKFEADDSRVRSAKAEAQKNTSSTHTIYVKKVHVNAEGGLVQHFAEGGSPRLSRQPAGLISGPGTGTSDSIMSLIGNGEYILREAAVKHYGVDFLNALNSMVMPVRAFANGGAPFITRTMGRPAYSPSQDSFNQFRRDAMDVNIHVGRKQFTVQSSRDVAVGLAKALREFSRAS